jgi:hypothetical protein
MQPPCNSFGSFIAGKGRFFYQMRLFQNFSFWNKLKFYCFGEGAFCLNPSVIPPVPARRGGECYTGLADSRVILDLFNNPVGY